VTLPVKAAAAAWTVSLTDEAHKLVFSRLGDRLRIAGTAELTGYDASIN
jgi:D-amino-acid dehydrogenase